MRTKKGSTVVLISSILVLAALSNAYADYNYTTLSVPGYETYAFGISGNSIVGAYKANGPTPAVSFLYNGPAYSYVYDSTTQTYTTLTPPGYSEAWGISGNNIVGQEEGVGYLYNGSTYTTIQFPGESTAATGISGGNIVGFYNNGASSSNGFVYDGTTYTTLSAPGASSGGPYLVGPWEKGTLAFGISGNNIVGWYTDANSVVHGFLYNGTAYATLDVPGGSNTWAFGISGNNIVGTYEDASGYEGFLYNITTQTYTSLQVPGSTWTEAWGIDGNNIVGWYRAGGVDYGFLATPTPVPTSLLLLAPGLVALAAVRRRVRK